MREGGEMGGVGGRRGERWEGVGRRGGGGGENRIIFAHGLQISPIQQEYCRVHFPFTHFPAVKKFYLNIYAELHTHTGKHLLEVRL